MRHASILALPLVVACAAVPSTPPEAPPGAQAIQMEAVRIAPVADPLTGLDTYDAGDLLERGNSAFDKGDFDLALKVYDKLVKQFPDSSLVATALYNAALSLERLAEYGPAVERYERVLSEHASSAHAKDALYRSGLCLAKLERWPEVEKVFWAVRQQSGLTPMDELEARVGLAIALFMQEEYATAEREFLAAVRFHDEVSKKQYLPANYWVAQSRFYLGEITAREFEAYALASDEKDHERWRSAMGERLEEKCGLLLRAQTSFIRAIREGHTGWATAAGFRIGSLYERLYDDLVGVPVPADLSPEAATIYRHELEKKVGVLVKKAITVYERSLDMAQRVGEANEWVKRTEAALERMKALALGAMEG